MTEQTINIEALVEEAAILYPDRHFPDSQGRSGLVHVRVEGGEDFAFYAGVVDMRSRERSAYIERELMAALNAAEPPRKTLWSRLKEFIRP